MPFEGISFTDFWDDSEYAKKEYIGNVPTDELISEVEKELGYKLRNHIFGLCSSIMEAFR